MVVVTFIIFYQLRNFFECCKQIKWKMKKNYDIYETKTNDKYQGYSSVARSLKVGHVNLG